MTAGAGPTPLTRPKTGRTLGAMFLPDQLAWINDESDAKLWDKCRRYGATYCEAYDSVSSRFRRQTPRDCDYWFSSADRSAGEEFIDYCRFFAKDLFSSVADVYSEQIEDPATRRMETATVIRRPNGFKITAMTSNPRRFRSKGGDVCLDEYGYHDDARGMMKAAQPVTLRGGRLRVMSTANGEGSQYNKLVQNCRKTLAALGYDPNDPPRFVRRDGLHSAAGLSWAIYVAKARELRLTPVFAYHRVTIHDAVAQGLVELINRTTGTKYTRAEFIQRCRDQCIDEEAWLEEFNCTPGSDKTAWLTYELIEGCEDDGCPQPDEGLAGYEGGYCTLGVDVARSRDLTVAWLLEDVGDVRWTRRIDTLHDMKLPDQQERLVGLLAAVKWGAALFDKTGLGLGLFEYTERKLGGRIAGLDFTNPAKHALATTIKQAFADRTVRIPASSLWLREELHKVRKSVTDSGLVRFEGERTKDGHADAFWALALALEAGKGRGASGLSLI